MFRSFSLVLYVDRNSLCSDHSVYMFSQIFVSTILESSVNMCFITLLLLLFIVKNSRLIPVCEFVKFQKIRSVVGTPNNYNNGKMSTSLTRVLPSIK